MNTIERDIPELHIVVALHMVRASATPWDSGERFLVPRPMILLDGGVHTFPTTLRSPKDESLSSSDFAGGRQRQWVPLFPGSLWAYGGG